MLAISRKAKAAEAPTEPVGMAAEALEHEEVFRAPVRENVEPIAEHSDHRAHA